MEKIEPSEEVMELTKKIIEQNQTVLKMNERLLVFLSTPQWEITDSTNLNDYMSNKIY